MRTCHKNERESTHFWKTFFFLLAWSKVRKERKNRVKRENRQHREFCLGKIIDSLECVIGMASDFFILHVKFSHFWHTFDTLIFKDVITFLLPHIQRRMHTNKVCCIHFAYYIICEHFMAKIEWRDSIWLSINMR